MIFSRPGVELWYEKFGPDTGTPVIGIMGLAAHAGYWSPELIQAISKERPLVIFDNRGVARSSGDCQNLSMALLADDIASLMDHLAIPKAHILGVSMGGMIALTFALRYPKRLATLTLGCTTAKPKKFNLNLDMISPAVQSLRQGGKVTPILLSKAFIAQNPDKASDFENRIQKFKVLNNVFWEQIKACWAYDVSERISEISVPTLIMTGDKDIIMPHQCSKDLAQMIPGSSLHIFPGSGHAFILENQDDVIQLTKSHWQKVP